MNILGKLSISMSNRIKNLHVANVGKNDMYVSDFIRFCRVECPSSGSLFYAIGAEEKEFYRGAGDCMVQKNSVLSYSKLVPVLYRAEKIILHGLFDSRLTILLALNPWLLKKCYWIIWGGDLYQYQSNQQSIKKRVKEIFRKFVIRRVGFLVTNICGDVDLARSWYGAKGKHLKCFVYPSNIFEERLTGRGLSNDDICLLVGNSADPSNEHIEVLAMLEKYKDENILIFCPLAYGDLNYSEKVIQYGESIFGRKFCPLTEFLPLSEYRELLSRIDIAIFNHRRQQAMGNIINILGKGKKVYMRSDVSHRKFLEQIGVKVFCIEDFNLSPIEVGAANNNSAQILEYYSRERLKNQLFSILVS